MNISFFIGRKIRKTDGESFSSTVTNIAISSIAVGLFVMIISFAILEGFKRTIRDKIISFGSHIQITKFDENDSFEEMPMSVNRKNRYDKISQIDHVQSFSLKTGLLKTEEEVHGIIFKGIDADFNQTSFQQNLIEGRFPNLQGDKDSKEVLLSRRMANKLRLKLNDEVLVYFIQNPPRYRKIKITGIYQTGMEEFDEYYVIGDLQLIRKINGWNDSIIGGIEIFVKDFQELTPTSEAVYDAMDIDLQMEVVTEKYIQIFDWLRLLDKNVIIFLIIIMSVAGFNMMSTVVVLMMERTNMIGILKAVGATNTQIGLIFLYNGLHILFKGLLLGNIFGIGYCLIQYYFHVVPLDPDNYYMDAVPIHWDFVNILFLNLIISGLIILALLVPIIILPNIKPVKAIKFS